MTEINRLLDIMATLRDPEKGCPWDSKQTFKSVAPYTIEEAYEVAEAAEQDDMQALKAELGDLLLQVVFHARMAEEGGLFDFDAVVESICDKLIRRHPHVFADKQFENDAARSRAWEDQKAVERGHAGILDGVATTLPALTRAVKLQKRASRVGFDWNEIEPVIAKIDEELDELETEINEGSPKEKLEDELGDVFFAIANLARHLKLDPEQAVRSTNRKFERRFNAIEAELAERGLTPEEVDLDTMDAIWVAAKGED